MQFLSGNPEPLQTAFLAALVIMIVLLGMSVVFLVILLRRKGGGDFAPSATPETAPSPS